MASKKIKLPESISADPKITDAVISKHAFFGAECKERACVDLIKSAVLPLDKARKLIIDHKLKVTDIEYFGMRISRRHLLDRTAKSIKKDSDISQLEKHRAEMARCGICYNKSACLVFVYEYKVEPHIARQVALEHGDMTFDIKKYTKEYERKFNIDTAPHTEAVRQ